MAAIELLSLLKKHDIYSMRSIRHANLMFLDGTNIYLWLFRGGETDSIKWHVSNYDDARYNEIQAAILKVYKNELNVNSL